MYVLAEIRKNYKIKVSEPNNFVGLEINRIKSGDIILTQQRLIQKMLEDFNLVECKGSMIPMQPNPDLQSVPESKPNIPYRELIGSLLFLSRTTRPDIAYAVGKLPQFCHGYNESHWKLGKTVARYLKATMSHGLEYKTNCSTEPTGYTDADYASNNQDRKSTSGVAFFLGTSLVTWTSQKQPIVVLSSTESEYVALAIGAKDAIWLRSFLKELGIPQELPTRILVDNQSAIKLAKNPEFHNRTKHIDVRFHYIRQLIQEKQLEVSYIPTNQQTADILTKPLSREKFVEMRGLLGMTSNKETVEPEDPKENSERQKTGRKAKKSGFLSLPMIFTMLMFMNVCSAIVFQTSLPLLWRPSLTPITKGNYRVMLTLRFINPCDALTNKVVHQEMITEVKSQCERMYKELFVEELHKMCPEQSKRTFLMRSKRFIISLTIGIIVATVVASIGITATTVAVVNSARISSINSVISEQAKKAEEMVARLDLLETAVNNLENDMDVIVQPLDDHMADYRELKGKYVTSTFLVSYITSRLMLSKQMLQEANRQMKAGKIYPPFLDYFNFTLPCGNDCPTHLASPRQCYFTDDHEEFFLDFDAPLVNKNLKMTEADPFELMIRDGNRTCRVTYTGPRNAIVSMEDGCIIGINVKPHATHDMILFPTAGCISSSKLPNETKYFSITSCEIAHTGDELDMVQVKPHYGSNYIYCPESEIKIDGTFHKCPDVVFVLPITASFEINGMEYLASTVHLEHQERSDPLFTLKANSYLQPNINLTTLLSHSKLQKKETNNNPPTLIEHPMTWSTMGIGIVIIVLIILLIYVFKRDKKIKIAVVAQTVNQSESENTEMQELRTRD